MIEPEMGSVSLVVKRRRTRRHRRNRLIRRGLVAVAITAGVSTLALRYFSPSLFQAGKSAPPIIQHAELGGHSNPFDAVLSSAAPATSRPVYPYSVVPGGVEDAKELKWVAEHDPVVAAHYAGFDYDHARVVRLTLARTVYVSYRIGNNIYWTRRRLTLHKGEKLITDGRMTARSRCANRVEEAPQQAAAPVEPPVQKFEEPVRAGDGTAMRAPPVPFQSALLNRPEMPGLGPVEPLSLYNPFVGGTWIPIAPPPLPAGLCSPSNKNVPTEDCGCTAETGNKKKCGSGSSGTVPEPGTWLLFASGLAAIYWQARRKLTRFSRG